MTQKLDLEIGGKVLIPDNVHIVLKDKDGNIKLDFSTHNTVVTAGKNHIADRLSTTPTGAAMSHMGIGTNNTAVVAGDTALNTELDRNALTSCTDSSNVVTYVADWAAGDGTGAIVEAGIFNAASVGTMLARTVFSAINKGASDTLQITWTLTIG